MTWPFYFKDNCLKKDQSVIEVIIIRALDSLDDNYIKQKHGSMRKTS